jgi:hypothetical protein
MKIGKAISRLSVCVLLLIVAALIIVPLTWEKRSAKVSKCEDNLWQIRACKQLWVGNYGKTSNDIPTWDDLRPFFPVEWSNHIPVCPSGGTYTIGPVGQNPTCSIGGKGHSIQ